MNEIILIEKNPKFESLYSLNLRIYLDVTIHAKRKTEFAINMLEKGESKPSMIIVRSMIDKENSALDIVNYLESAKLDVPVVVLGHDKRLDGKVEFIPSGLNLKDLLKSSAKALNISAQEMAQKVVPDHFPIPINFFLELDSVICDVYEQDLDDESNYEVKMNKGEDCDNELIKGYVSSGIAQLYVNKFDRLKFVNSVTNEMVSKLESNDLNKHEQLHMAERSIDLVKEKLFLHGMTPETDEAVKRSLKSVVNATKSSPSIRNLLKNLLSNKMSYLYKHSQILTYISLNIAKKMEWSTKEQEDKLAFVSYFHDILLKNDLEAKIDSDKGLKAAGLASEDFKRVNEHAQKAAELSIKCANAPHGVDVIIRQHHGIAHGVGYSEFYGGNISPLTIVFIIAEYYTELLLENEQENIPKSVIVEKLKEKFQTSRFRKIVEAIESTEEI